MHLIHLSPRWGFVIDGINVYYTPIASPRLSKAYLSTSGAEGV
ncbi:MAG: hypothetical protein OXM61_05285 [Candidatus Poribacteria bacterium]|nr:hypothetical protein [Candidatus Poribacteria bacterium]